MANRLKVVVDTSKLMESVVEVEKMLETHRILIPYTVLEELDNHKDNYKDSKRSFKGRRAIRFINNNYDDLLFKECNDEINKNDNKIIDVAQNSGAAIFTDDICMEVKARALDIEVVKSDSETEKESYHGYKIVNTGCNNVNKKLAEIYEDRTANPFELENNEYLIVEDGEGNIRDKMKFTNGECVGFSNKVLKSNAIGTIKPLDEYQSCLIDSLVSNKMTMARGRAGSGKSLLSLAYALSEIEKGEYNKLTIFVNPIASRNSGRLGYYPGTRLEKVLDSFLGSMLSSKLGGIEGVYQMVERGELEILPFSDIRGHDTSGTKSIVYIVEAQNLDIDLMKLAIQRVSDDCKLIIDGDNNSQVDMRVYEGLNNGMSRVSEVFRGEDFYGEVELQNIHRSIMAEIADKM